MKIRDIHFSCRIEKIGTEPLPTFDLTEAAKKYSVLILEPLYSPSAAWGRIRGGFLPPLGSISIYSWLKHRKYHVEFLDTQFGDFDESSLKDHILKGGYDMVAMSVFTPTADYAFATAKAIRKVLPGAAIVLGGVHSTAAPDLTLEQCPECDFIVRHEGEVTLDELISTLANNEDVSAVRGLVYRRNDQIVHNSLRPFIQNLDDLPLGFYGDLDLSRYIPHSTQYIRLPNYPLVTQRGCPYHCSFCSGGLVLGKKIRFFSPRRIVEEMKILLREKGARGVYFQDSTFSLNRKWVMDLLALMKKENLGLVWSCNTRTDRVDREMLAAMKEAGCRRLVFGIETGNQSSLDRIGKAITVEKQTQGIKWVKEAGLEYFNSYILCLPGEDDRMVKRTVDYARKLGSPMAVFWLPVPFPGTTLFEECRKDGTLLEDVTWEDFLSIDPKNPIYINPKIGRAGMIAWRRRAFFHYYRDPRIWWAIARNIRNAEDFRRVLRGGHAIWRVISDHLFSLAKGRRK